MLSGALVRRVRSDLAVLRQCEQQDIKKAAEELAKALDSYDQPMGSNDRRKPVSTKSLLRRLGYQKKQRQKEQKQRKAEAGVQKQKQLQHIWLVRTMLAPVNVPQRTLSNFMTEFSVTETKQISHTSVASVRDAFCETLKRLQVDRCRNMHTSDRRSLTIVHVHDGCDMRVRTYSRTLQSCDMLEMPHGSGALSRSRSCKIQNHCLHLFFPSGNMPWLSFRTVFGAFPGFPGRSPAAW